jgi:hypothetical protein
MARDYTACTAEERIAPAMKFALNGVERAQRIPLLDIGCEVRDKKQPEAQRK